jgi:hypothetical protein
MACSMGSNNPIQAFLLTVEAAWCCLLLPSCCITHFCVKLALALQAAGMLAALAGCLLIV